MRLNKRFLFYLILMAVFFAYLIAANYIFVALSENPRLRLVNRSDFPGLSQFRINIIDRGLVNDIYDSFFLSTWPGPEEMQVLLVSENGWYSAPLPTTSGGEFSSIPLKNGIYELYLYVAEENENNGRFQRIGIRFIKDRDGFREYIPSRVVNFDYLPLSSDIFGSLDYMMLDANAIMMEGWFAVLNESTLFQNTYIELTNGAGEVVTFSTTNLITHHLVPFFGEFYQYSGFRTEIPLQLLDGWDGFTVAIILENEGVLSRLDDGRDFCLKEKSMGANLLEFTSKRVSNFGYIPLNDDVLGGIDLLTLEADRLKIGGYLTKDGISSLRQNVYLELKNYSGDVITYRTLRHVKTDRVKNLENWNYMYSGFSAEILFSDLYGWDEFTISIVLEDEGDFYKWNHSVMSHVRALVVMSGQGKFTSKKVPNFYSEMYLDRIHANLGIIESKDENIVINGYALNHFGEPTAYQNVYIELTSVDGNVKTFDTIKMVSVGVANAFNEPSYALAGFKAVIPLTELAGWDEFTISIVIENGGILSLWDYEYVYSLRNLE